MKKKIKLNKTANFLWPNISTKLIRIGPNEDGGYVLAASSYKLTQQVISFGVNVDWRFERQLYNELTIPIYLFEAESVLKLSTRYWLGGLAKFLLGKVNFHILYDRTLRLFDYFVFFSYKNIKLKKKWIDKESASLIFKNCPENTLLKCDIEGAEYEILECIITNKNKFNIVAMEVHNVSQNLERLEFFVNNMNDLFYITHFHANNSSVIGENMIPDVLEITFSKKSSIFDCLPPTNILPIKKIDFPSVKHLEDYIFIRP